MTEITIAPVTREDVSPLIAIELPEDQRRFVAPNAVSLAQVHYEPGGHAFCIRAGGRRAGLMQVIDCREQDDRDAGDDPDAVYLWRLLIAPALQGRGIGRRAVGWLEGWARARGRRALRVAAVPDNAVALALYESCGFTRTGRVVEGEVELVKSLADPPAKPPA